MRNKFPGQCYRCGLIVNAGEGHFERLQGSWRVQHANCAIEFRGQPDPCREAVTQARRERVAAGTGRSAQKARRRLRDEASRAALKHGGEYTAHDGEKI